MSANNHHPPNSNSIRVPSLFGNSPSSSSAAHAHHQFQSQSQQLTGPRFPNQFQLSQLSAARGVANYQAQSKAQAQAQAAHAQFRAQLQQAQLHANPVGNLGLSPGIGSSGLKRFLQKPPAQPPRTVSPIRRIDSSSDACKKKQKLPEKQLQERVVKILPESAIYTQLLEFESRVDDALSIKKTDIQEALKKPQAIQKTLRIYVFNTFANQICTTPERSNPEPPTWTLKIIGRILEESMVPNHSSMYPKFSSFFKRISISLDQNLYPDNHIIIWDRARAPAFHEGFEIKRKGNQEFTANIRLELNYLPEKYKVSPALKEVLGVEVDTRARIINAILQYIKARKLQNPDDPSCFICDPPLQKVFGEGTIKFTEMTQKITCHLSPPQPIHIEHRITLSGNNPAGSACYDVRVDVPVPIQRELNYLLANTDKTNEIGVCDEAICEAIKKIHEHRKRRAFFLGFSQSPAEFVNSLVDFQSKDIKFVAGEASHNAEKGCQSDLYSQPWVEDAIIRYLNRKPATDAAGTM